jgi:hypothetical protein
LVIRSVWADLADRSNSHHHAQVAYLKVILGKIESGADASADLGRLADLLLRWIGVIAGERSAIFTSQYIAVRPVLAILGYSRGQERAKQCAAESFLGLMTARAEMGGLPLLLLARIVIKAVQSKDKAAYEEVVKVFKPMLEKDPEFGKWITRINNVYFRPGDPLDGMGNLPQLGNIVNGLLQRMTQGK